MDTIRAKNSAPSLDAASQSLGNEVKSAGLAELKRVSWKKQSWQPAIKPREELVTGLTATGTGLNGS